MKLRASRGARGGRRELRDTERGRCLIPFVFSSEEQKPGALPGDVAGTTRCVCQPPRVSEQLCLRAFSRGHASCQPRVWQRQPQGPGADVRVSALSDTPSLVCLRGRLHLQVYGVLFPRSTCAFCLSGSDPVCGRGCRAGTRASQGVSPADGRLLLLRRHTRSLVT